MHKDMSYTRSAPAMCLQPFTVHSFCAENREKLAEYHVSARLHCLVIGGPVFEGFQGLAEKGVKGRACRRARLQCHRVEFTLAEQGASVGCRAWLSVTVHSAQPV